MTTNIRDISIQGLVFFTKGYDSLIEEINQDIKNSRNCVVLTPTTEIVGRAIGDKYYRKVVQSGTILLPDSITLILLARFLFKKIYHRLTGIDTLYRLGQNTKNKYKVFYLGAKQENLEKAIRVSKDIFPAFEIVGSHNGYFTEKDNDRIVSLINKSKADIVFVGTGFPKQEKFVYETLKALKTPVKITVGGSFDVLSGVLKRAPQWMQKIGLEWLFRLIQEPNRITRMSLIPFQLMKICIFELFYKD